MKIRIHIQQILTALFSVIFIPEYAACQEFHNKQKNINIGIGLLPVLDYSISSPSITTKSAVPPISGSIDFGVSDEFSVGGYLGYAKTNFESKGSTVASISHVLIGCRVLYHFSLSAKLDTYSGGMIALNGTKLSSNAISVSTRSFAYNILVGGRYHVSKNTGLFLEFGYGISILNLGITMKMDKNENNTL